MSVEEKAKQVREFIRPSDGEPRGGILFAAFFGSALLGGAVAYQTTFEEWNNVANENTAQVTTEFNQRAQDMKALVKKTELLNKSHEFSQLLEVVNNQGVTGFNSTDIENRLNEIKSQLIDGTQEYVTDLMLNKDITEEVMQQLMSDYGQFGLNQFGTELPEARISYAFKESQIAVEATSTEALTQTEKAQKILSEFKTHETDGGVNVFIAGLMSALAGMITLVTTEAAAIGVEKAARRRRKKPTVKRKSQVNKL